jgi:hypothetical protein
LRKEENARTGYKIMRCPQPFRLIKAPDMALGEQGKNQAGQPFFRRLYPAAHPGTPASGTMLAAPVIF